MNDMKTILKYALLVAVVLTGCGHADNSYEIRFDGLDEIFNGQTAYLVDYDTNDKIDSVKIVDRSIRFNGKIDNPVYVALYCNGRMTSNFVLEPGILTIENGTVRGGNLNEAIAKLELGQMNVIKEFRELPDSVRPSQSIYYDSIITSMTTRFIEKNIDNPAGYIEFLSGPIRKMSVSQIDSFVKGHPILENSSQIKRTREMLLNLEATSEGGRFKDFEVVFESDTFRLSDYVGHGRYVLVDFWASWCGPCLRQAGLLKELYGKYKSRGLDVIGVAVWDDPENTRQSIVENNLNWINVINAQNIPTDLYGITGIPCAILFGPDGTILSRGRQGKALSEAVANAMGD